MRRQSNTALCVAHGRVGRFGVQETFVETGGEGWLTTSGPLGPNPMVNTSFDLLDIATTVYAIERQLPPRGASNPNIQYLLTMPVREPDLWNGKPRELLQDILGFLGNTEWNIRFVEGRVKDIVLPAPGDQARPIRRIALLSGGLDSASGLGSNFTAAHETQLCSYYTKQKTLQRTIAETLEFAPPTQWRHEGRAGRGRSFYYRSLFFISLAAAVAHTWNASEILQFENGILAGSIPPVPSVSMTKHAHPKLHYLLAQLLKSIFVGDWVVTNPLWTMTKRQAVNALIRNVGEERANKITPITESCWNLAAPHAFGVSKLGRFQKRVNLQCGVCIPCIIRRSALPGEEYAFDLRVDRVRNHPQLGAFFLEYLELVSAIRSSVNTAEFRRALPAEGLDLIDGGWTTLSALEQLWRTFADEFHQSFL
jgi:hypothetical protein